MIDYNKMIFLKDKMPIKANMIYNGITYFDAYILYDNESLIAVTYKDGVIILTEKDKVNFIIKNN